ncbi:unnamed protein product [Peniophora sp. CBMAI 1063]|nr:unnamed protein product [Peniophora sp. CBMAI 1063]
MPIHSSRTRSASPSPPLQPNIKRARLVSSADAASLKTLEQAHTLRVPDRQDTKFKGLVCPEFEDENEAPHTDIPANHEPPAAGAELNDDTQLPLNGRKRSAELNILAYGHLGKVPFAPIVPSLYSQLTSHDDPPSFAQWLQSRAAQSEPSSREGVNGPNSANALHSV